MPLHSQRRSLAERSLSAFVLLAVDERLQCFRAVSNAVADSDGENVSAWKCICPKGPL